MKYISFNKKYKVLEISEQYPKTDLSVARCENIPQYDAKKGEYLEVINLKAFYGDDIIVIEKETDFVPLYYTCELIVKVNENILRQNKLKTLKDWFDNDYRYYSEKLTRFKALDIYEVVYDKLFGITYTSLNDLYIQGEKVRVEIKNLEVK